ncbi:PPK2 family polyphosphate kinase [Flavobacterium antarcticum]|uniref:PPK2 family polyphosphate kinase n=1 Tax=Flavobacterium antarcticum TaxID=271155 RepID=UPI0003B361E5|nr:PPK2 family polyphosphate kinase [Flavobacterium antarcticum]
MKNLNIEELRVTTQIKLADLPTKIEVKPNEKRLKEKLKKIRHELSELQDVMYAHDKYSLLVCLQGMDTAGKDSLIREVFKEINPRGVVVESFKTPTSAELEHDFLWRHYKALPERGKIGVFNRTHYENALVTRVHPEYLLKENIPTILSVEDIPENFWQERMKDMINFENHISKSGTIVLKFFLHLSKEEQRERLMRRLEKNKHNWKFSPGDLEERALWEKYQECYEEILNTTSTEKAPWFVVPADDKELARYIVAKIILTELKKHTDIQNPTLSEEVQENIKKYKKILSDSKE